MYIRRLAAKVPEKAKRRNERWRKIHTAEGRHQAIVGLMIVRSNTAAAAQEQRP